MTEALRVKTAFAPFATALRDGAGLRAAMDGLFTPDAIFHLCHPIGDVTGPEAAHARAFAPLLTAIPDLERRDWIVIAGHDQDGALWLGAGGHYMGTSAKPWLDIPATGHLVAMRYHEFFRFEGACVVEMQAIWDIPEVMMQAGVWPMAPSLGREMVVPGPMTQDGLTVQGDGTATVALVMEMLTAMKRHPLHGGPEAMEMPRYWHPRMNWYGPAGIGTARGMTGFRNWHQIPFLAAMPDRGQYPGQTKGHFFGQGKYAAVTGWPNMRQTLSGAGWLGLPPTGQQLTMRSLDFWRMEGKLVRENWVLVDLLDAFAQLGTDPLARMREFNKARHGFDPETGAALP